MSRSDPTVRLLHVRDYDILWDTIRHDFPALIAELDRILIPRA